MLQSIHAKISPNQNSGSIFDCCTKRFSALVQSVKEAVYSIFRTIFCCFSRAKEPKSETRSHKGEESAPTSLTPQPVEPLPPSLPASGAPTSSGSASSSGSGEPEIVPTGTLSMSEMVKKLWKMGTLQRNSYLDLIDPLPKAAVPAHPLQASKSFPTIGGTLEVSPHQHKAAICLAVIGVQTMVERIQEKEAITPDLLDGIHKEGLGWYKHCVGDSDEPGPIPYGDVLLNMEGFDPVALFEGKQAAIESAPIQRLIKLLRDAAKTEGCLGGVIFEGKIDGSPKIYGVVVTHNQSSGASEFHLFSPHGFDDKRTVGYRKFNAIAPFTAFFTKNDYSMMAMKPKKQEPTAQAGV